VGQLDPASAGSGRPTMRTENDAVVMEVEHTWN
jgi:hypothetical protein